MSMQTQAAARKVNKHIESIKRVSLYLPKSLGQRVEQSASQQLLSQNLLITYILRDWVIKQNGITEREQK